MKIEKTKVVKDVHEGDRIRWTITHKNKIYAESTGVASVNFGSNQNVITIPRENIKRLFKIFENLYPSYAKIMIDGRTYLNNTFKGVCGDWAFDKESVVWKVSADGYVTKSGTLNNVELTSGLGYLLPALSLEKISGSGNDNPENPGDNPDNPSGGGDTPDSPYVPDDKVGEFCYNLYAQATVTTYSTQFRVTTDHYSKSIVGAKLTVTKGDSIVFQTVLDENDSSSHTSYLGNISVDTINISSEKGTYNVCVEMDECRTFKDTFEVRTYDNNKKYFGVDEYMIYGDTWAQSYDHFQRWEVVGESSYNEVGVAFYLEEEGNVQITFKKGSYQENFNVSNRSGFTYLTLGGGPGVYEYTITFKDYEPETGHVVLSAPPKYKPKEIIIAEERYGNENHSEGVDFDSYVALTLKNEIGKDISSHDLNCWVFRNGTVKDELVGGAIGMNNAFTIYSGCEGVVIVYLHNSEYPVLKKYYRCNRHEDYESLFEIHPATESDYVKHPVDVPDSSKVNNMAVELIHEDTNYVARFYVYNPDTNRPIEGAKIEVRKNGVLMENNQNDDVSIVGPLYTVDNGYALRSYYKEGTYDVTIIKDGYKTVTDSFIYRKP